MVRRHARPAPPPSAAPLPVSRSTIPPGTVLLLYARFRSRWPWLGQLCAFIPAFHETAPSCVSGLLFREELPPPVTSGPAVPIRVALLHAPLPLIKVEEEVVDEESTKRRRRGGRGARRLTACSTPSSATNDGYISYQLP